MQFNRSAWLTIDGKTTEIFPNKSNRTDDWMADFSEETSPDGDSGLRLMLHPKADLLLENAEIQLVFQLEKGDQLFCNGFQSRAESGLFAVESGLPRPGFFEKKELDFSGDEHFKNIPRGRGSLHSWSFTFLKKADGSTFFIGSMDERTGFTLFLLDHESGRLTIRRDLERLDLRHSFPIFNLFFSKKDPDAATARWLEKSEITPPKAPPLVGWISGQQHSKTLSEAVILKNLEAVSELLEGQNSGEKTIIINDGWQTEIGDWLSPKSGFSGGMGPISQKIRQKGFISGLWLAPFVVSEKSEMFRKNPSWLLLNKHGKPLRIGSNPDWGGPFFALDFYKKEVREWLAGVFHIVIEKWGFGLVKLDFLFAAALQPPRGVTRGQAMHGAMEFLRKLVGDRLILGVGVPLGPAMGVVDFCSVGGEVLGGWERPFFSFLNKQKKPPTVASLHSVLSRSILNGRAFHCDPGGFVLRSDGQKLSAAKQYTLLIINVLCGNLLLTSDDPTDWKPEAQAEFEEAMTLRGAKILGVFETQNDVFRIEFLKNGERFSALSNLGEKPVFLSEINFELGAFETLITSDRTDRTNF